MQYPQEGVPLLHKAHSGRFSKALFVLQLQKCHISDEKKKICSCDLKKIVKNKKKKKEKEKRKKKAVFAKKKIKLKKKNRL